MSLRDVDLPDPPDVNTFQHRLASKKTLSQTLDSFISKPAGKGSLLLLESLIAVGSLVYSVNVLSGKKVINLVV